MKETKRERFYENPDFIIFSAFMAATPRWVASLMLSEGLEIPLQIAAFWPVISLGLNAYMAATEGFALSFLFSRMNNAHGSARRNILAFAIALVITFTVVLTPFIAASVLEIRMQELLAPIGAWVWGAAVALTTMITIAAVGYAEAVTTEPAERGKVNLGEILSKVASIPDPVAAQDYLTNNFDGTGGLTVPQIETLRRIKNQ